MRMFVTKPPCAMCMLPFTAFLILTTLGLRGAPRERVSSITRFKAHNVEPDAIVSQLRFELQPYKQHEMCTDLADSLDFDDPRKTPLRAAVFTLDDDETNDPYSSNWELDKACADAFGSLKASILGSHDGMSVFEFVDRLAKCEVDAEGHTLLQSALRNGFNSCVSAPLVKQVLLVPSSGYHPVLATTRDKDNLLHLVVQSNSEVMLTKALKVVASYPYRGKSRTRDTTGNAVLYSLMEAKNDKGDTPVMEAERSGNLARRLKTYYRTLKTNLRTALNEAMKAGGLPTDA
ncbi:MAG: uncharacterized protein KVP18_004404 [Porospora cf. gigantea A]|uniref:uncharacterized protein n=2 Tax=Porospora cf. gigantea A TaxID=2853593 RepID=UPI00355A2185|nr:MAG: hypothetical protein KVP18_004404 [Porospora cf. gigantea A]